MTDTKREKSTKHSLNLFTLFLILFTLVMVLSLCLEWDSSVTIVFLIIGAAFVTVFAFGISIVKDGIDALRTHR